MNILGIKFSSKLHPVYKAALNSGKHFEFKDISEHPNPYFREFISRNYGGLRETAISDPQLINIYFTKTERVEDMEKVVAHELCHEILRNQGFDYAFRVNSKFLEENLQKSYSGKELERKMKESTEKLDVEFTYIYNCFIHVAVNTCMKNHGYDVVKGKATYDKIKHRIRQIEKTDKEQILLEAIFYLGEIYKDKYSCSELKPSKLENIYKNGNSQILEATNKLKRLIPNTNLLNPLGCYEAIKSLRDAFFIELEVPQQRTLFELRNPWTGLSE